VEAVAVEEVRQVRPLPMGDVPHLQEQVTVMGFPQGRVVQVETCGESVWSERLKLKYDELLSCFQFKSNLRLRIESVWFER